MRASWADKPMRWGQLTLTDRDPEDLDVQFWLDTFSGMRCDGVCLSAGGYLAYYPTEVDLHRRSGHLGDRDPFGELVAGCRSLGMVVLARTDPHAVRDEIRLARPEWIQADKDGQHRPHWAMAGAWLTCMLGDYNFTHMSRVHREIVARYDVQAIFTNRWMNIGICYCRNCRTSFAEATGHALPLASDPHDPIFRQYQKWQHETYLALVDSWDADIRAVNPDARLIPNTTLPYAPGAQLINLDITRLMPKVDLLFADRQGRSGAEPSWSSGRTAKFYRSAARDKPVGGIFSMGLEEAYRWKDSVQSGAETALWVADSVANGMRPWWTKFGGTVPDRRWISLVGDRYRWYHDCERYLRNERSLARVGVVYSSLMATQMLGGQQRQDFEDHLAGAYHALLENRIPFELINAELLGPDELADIDVLVLPGLAMLSDAQCAEIARFVRAGGGLVATHATSLFDEHGNRREEFGLGELFGARPAGEPEGPMRNSYLALGADRSHPLLAGFDGTDRIINGVHRIPVEETAPVTDPALRLIASYPDLPMEEVYVRDTRPGPPQVFQRQVGAGRVVYFPWDIDRTFWEVLHPDHGRLITAAVRWAGAAEPVVTVDGPGLLDITVWRQADSVTVHLVNMTNPMTMRGPLRDFVPVGPQRVRILLPPRSRPTAVRLLDGGQVFAEPEVHEGRVEVTVPQVVCHEIVAVDLA